MLIIRPAARTALTAAQRPGVPSLRRLPLLSMILYQSRDRPLDAASLAKLGYRELQAECKRRGLLAIGRREELIGRLAPEAPA